MTAAFDEFGQDYAPGRRSLLKRLLGGGFESYIQSKVDWYVAELSGGPAALADVRLRLLDYGCGTGEFLRLLRGAGFSGQVRGCDVSAEMLKTAEARWTLDGPAPFDHFAGGALPYGPESFDLAVSSCVFHHIEPSERAAAYGALFDVLAPGGRIAVFEHNPSHPLTRYAVSRAPEDADAVLLAPSELTSGLQAAGFANLRSRPVLILPPRFPGASRIDRWLGALPIGAQYVVAGDKPGLAGESRN